MNRLADDRNENHNYIACLFIFQTAYSNSSFHYLNYFHEQRLRKSKKIYFCIEFFIVEFSGELKFKTRNELILVLCPTLAAHSSLFTASKIEYWYSHLPVRSAGQLAGWRKGGVASHHKTISSSTAAFLLCWKKKCYTRYSLLNVLIMTFLISALNVILLDGAHILWKISYFKSFWVLK